MNVKSEGQIQMDKWEKRQALRLAPPYTQDEPEGRIKQWRLSVQDIYTAHVHGGGYM